MNEKQATNPPPAWALEPLTGWLYLAVSVGLALTPLFPLVFVLAIVAAVFTYQDRKAHGFPIFWWTAGVLLIGALVYLFFIYKRARGAVVYAPEAAIGQQAHMVRGIPPRPPAAAAAAPADWYPDPTGSARVRYWNGSEWTDHTAE